MCRICLISILVGLQWRWIMDSLKLNEKREELGYGN